MDGALALALPLRYGQMLEVTPAGTGAVDWTSRDLNGTWFTAQYSLPRLDVVRSGDSEKALILQGILRTADGLSGGAIGRAAGWEVSTVANFDRHWGLGTSSTLLACLSQWLKIDPFELLHQNFDASGYDVACALAEGPVLYQVGKNNPVVEQVDFNPEFSEHLWFVYSGAKQDTRQSIRSFRDRKKGDNGAIQEISRLTAEMIEVKSLMEFMQLISRHEEIMHNLLGMEKVQERFPGFNGALKSLGAWGGDFILAVTENDEGYVREYFRKKGLDTVFAFEEITLRPGVHPYPVK